MANKKTGKWRKADRVKDEQFERKNETNAAGDTVSSDGQTVSDLSNISVRDSTVGAGGDSISLGTSQGSVPQIGGQSTMMPGATVNAILTQGSIATTDLSSGSEANLTVNSRNTSMAPSASGSDSQATSSQSTSQSLVSRFTRSAANQRNMSKFKRFEGFLAFVFEYMLLQRYELTAIGSKGFEVPVSSFDPFEVTRNIEITRDNSWTRSKRLQSDLTPR